MNASRSLNGLKILVVDDSKTIRRTAETLLTKEGCQVFTAIDGLDALSKIADHQPDLIFVDIMMPRLDGGVDRRSIGQRGTLIRCSATFGRGGAQGRRGCAAHY
ncbi:MAG: response regulator [Proteobacteria bacterium]|nr:response regulator [Pseudomonadota bacterium]